MPKLTKIEKSEGPPWFSGCGLVLPLSPLHPFYRLLMFDTSTLALAQIVGMASERRLNISLIIPAESLDLPFERITLRTGHPILTSLTPQKRPSLKGRTPTIWDASVSAVEVPPHHKYTRFLGAAVPWDFSSNTLTEEFQPLLIRREGFLVGVTGGQSRSSSERAR